jgi:predicted DNA-binding ribbon-helix-helix protein
MYHGTLVTMAGSVEVERIQTGVRMEKRLLKVLKAVAELKDMTLGDLLEGIVLHAFEGKSAFSAQTLKEIEQFRSIYGLTLHASDSHRLKERK